MQFSLARLLYWFVLIGGLLTVVLELKQDSIRGIVATAFFAIAVSFSLYAESQVSRGLHPIKAAGEILVLVGLGLSIYNTRSIHSEPTDWNQLNYLLQAFGFLLLSAGMLMRYR